MANEGQTIFYNPKVAAIKIELSVIANTTQISLAKTLNPNRSGRPKPGEKMYDWDNASFFSLTPEECVPIDFLWDKILLGEYVDPKAKNKEYANYYNVTHFRSNQPSLLSLVRSEHQARPKDPLMTLALMVPDKERCSYQFRKAEMIIFREFIRFGYQQLPMQSAMMGAIRRMNNKNEYDRKEKEIEDRKTNQPPPSSNTPPPSPSYGGGGAPDDDIPF